MTPHRTWLALAALAVVAAAGALAQTPSPGAAAPAVPATAPTTAGAATEARTPARNASGSPSEWIRYEDATYTPVVDDVSRALADVRAALARKDYAAAAKAMSAAAAALATQADHAARLDRQRAAADLELARDTRTRLATLVEKLDLTAAQIAAGKIPSTAALDDTLTKTARADLERRWLVSDVTLWYPVVGESHEHLRQAMAAYLRNDYRSAATDVRKTAGYVRLEAARASGATRAALVDSDRELGALATRLDTGSVTSKQDLARSFARAEHSLAVAHRSRAAEAWVRKAYDSTGYELDAAAQGLEGSASWLGDEAVHRVRDSVADARAVGDKLAAGGVWTRDEVAKGFTALAQGLNAIGRGIGRKDAAKPVDVGR
ncbi:MAG: hypothetical protein IT522_15240 [Burkholderiales bacterium]|nr:hypothetical protein [Burkholderiales bacterium]